MHYIAGHSISSLISFIFLLFRLPSTSPASAKPCHHHTFPSLLHHPKASPDHLPCPTVQNNYHSPPALACPCGTVICQSHSRRPSESCQIPSSTSPTSGTTAPRPASTGLLQSKGGRRHIMATDAARPDGQAALPCGNPG